jgi:hypothetical protein
MSEAFASADFSGIEQRILGNETERSKLYEFAAQLPRRHPMRFGLLYGMGPQKLYDYVKKLALPSRTERKLQLEAEIQCFENWQRNETHERAVEKSLLFAMQFGLGLQNPDARMPVPEDSSAVYADTVISPTGRLASHEPEMQWIRRGNR